MLSGSATLADQRGETRNLYTLHIVTLPNGFGSIPACGFFWGFFSCMLYRLGFTPSGLRPGGWCAKTHRKGFALCM